MTSPDRSIHCSMRWGKERNKFAIQVCDRLTQISWIISSKSTRLLGLLFSTAIFISPHTFSIGFKSGKLAGHCVTCFSRNHFSVYLKRCGVAPLVEMWILADEVVEILAKLLGVFPDIWDYQWFPWSKSIAIFLLM